MSHIFLLELKLKICPNCKAQNVFEGAQFCKECGAPIGDSANPNLSGNAPDSDDKLEFVVTEAAGSGAPDFIGVDKSADSKKSHEDDLEIKTTANLLDDEATSEITAPPGRKESCPIGDSAPAAAVMRTSFTCPPSVDESAVRIPLRPT